MATQLNFFQGDATIFLATYIVSSFALETFFLVELGFIAFHFGHGGGGVSVGTSSMSTLSCATSYRDSFYDR